MTRAYRLQYSPSHVNWAAEVRLAGALTRSGAGLGPARNSVTVLGFCGNLPASDHGTDSLAGDTRVSVMFRVTRLTRLVVTGSVTVTGPSERVTNLAESLAF